MQLILCYYLSSLLKITCRRSIQ